MSMTRPQSLVVLQSCAVLFLCSMFVGTNAIWATEEEWGPFSGAAGLTQSSGSSAGVFISGSYEYNYKNDDSASDGPGALVAPAVSLKSATPPRHGIDGELSLMDIEIDTAGVLAKEQTEVLSFSYVRLWKLESPGIRFRLGGGLSYFNFDEADLGFHLKAEVQVPLRQEGNIGLVLGAVYYQPDSDLDFTAFRVGIRLHKAKRR